VGTAASAESSIWFTVSHGIVNDVYHPSVDRANTRDMGLLVTDGAEFFSEEKRDANHVIDPLAVGVPGYRLVNTCNRGRYRITKSIFTDPRRDVLIQQVKFEALKGSLSDYHLYVLLAPHISNEGAANDGWVGEYKGIPMLFARRMSTTLAMASSTSWLGRSCGYVGVSDGWQDLHDHKRMLGAYPEANDGNIALIGEIDLAACNGEFVLLLAIGANPSEAGLQSRTVLLSDIDSTRCDYISGWQEYQSRCVSLNPQSKEGFDLYRVSTAVLRTHVGKQFPGGLIASLSIPWGFSKGDNDIGGYHLVWPRDQVEATGALLAAGNASGARDTLLYLMSTQEPDGHWPQNMWLDGTSYWTGIQNDETAFVILLADMLRRGEGFCGLDPWPAVRLAVQFLVAKGPVTMQDRWEENAGISTFTLAAEIAALVAAAGYADAVADNDLACYLRETADAWNASIEDWLYVTDTDLARQVGVDGYYIRIAPPSVAFSCDPKQATISLKNRLPGQDQFPAADLVSPDALALVRFGLRGAKDPRIVNTVKVIDAVLKSETKTGPVWRRYNHDGYGEEDDGSPFRGAGVGRGWPLLTGERAHYELAAGNRTEAERLLGAMTAQTSPGGFIPEQVWDGPDIPARELYNGRPSGSGMPLVWAHAEYIKLLRSLRDGKIFDLQPEVFQRYVVDDARSQITFWRFDHPCTRIAAGKILRVELHAPALVHWSVDNWQTIRDMPTKDTGLGMYISDLDTKGFAKGTTLLFTFRWEESGRWEGTDFQTVVA
jgi:glucoamylase